MLTLVKVRQDGIQNPKGSASEMSEISLSFKENNILESQG
jgi:hypothetical protein